MEKRSEQLGNLVDKHKETFIDVSAKIWEYAEPRFQEYKSSNLHQETMQKLGFRVTANLAGEETAFIAEWGSGKPIIGFLGEFDALSGLSNEADVPEHKPLEGATQGHGCGHNLLGAGAALAAAATRDYMMDNALSGTVRFYGCPAEENAGGKAFLVRDGLFDDCDIVVTWHPSMFNQVTASGSLANFRVFYDFTGTSAHAAGSPHLGRSALDAVEIMNVGANYMREHMISDARVHYAVTDTGGTAPNVVQSKAQVLYAMRAPTVHQVKELKERLDKIAQGAALITETSVVSRQVSAYSNTRFSEVVSAQMDKHFREFFPLEYTDEELDYARKFTAVTTDLDKKNLPESLKKLLPKDEAAKWKDAPMMNFVGPAVLLSRGSTDVGDVSWVVPTGQIYAATWAPATAGHSWQATAQAKGSIAHKAMVGAAKVMAATAIDFFLDPELVKEARAKWLEDLDGDTYPNPLPAGYMPELW